MNHSYGVMGMEGIEITFLDPPYPKIGGGRIYSLFLREHSLLSPFPNCICSGLNPRLVETGRWGVYKGDIVLLPSFHCSDPTRSPSPRPDQILVQKWTTLVQKSICFLALSTCFFLPERPTFGPGRFWFKGLNTASIKRETKR